MPATAAIDLAGVRAQMEAGQPRPKPASILTFNGRSMAEPNLPRRQRKSSWNGGSFSRRSAICSSVSAYGMTNLSLTAWPADHELELELGHRLDGEILYAGVRMGIGSNCGLA
ncbi:MAG: hypothetical protein ACYDH9_19885 [Limisphaerales bacterium]